MATPMTVDKIETWRTSDGQAHATEKLAEVHAARENLRAFVLDAGVGAGGPWTAPMVADWVVENGAALDHLLRKLRAMGGLP